MDPLPKPCPHSDSELAHLADLFPNSNQTVSRTAAVSADAPSSHNLSAYRPSFLPLTWPAIHTSDHLHAPTEPAAARLSSSVVRSSQNRATIKTIAEFGFQVLVEPFNPASLSIRLVHGIARVVSSRGKGDEFHGDAVVLQRMVHLVGIGDWHARVAGVVEDQCGCGDCTRIGHG